MARKRKGGWSQLMQVEEVSTAHVPSLLKCETTDVAVHNLGGPFQVLEAILQRLD